MAEKLGIIFLHHNTSPEARRNLASIRAHNSDAVLVTMSAGEPFKNGYTLQSTPDLKPLHALDPAQSPDWLLCSWFTQRQEQCDKWWIVEWDTFARVSVRDYYRAVWEYPFVASSVRLPYREPEWAWFNKISNLPPIYSSSLVGGVPFIYLVSDDVIKRACTTLLEVPITSGNGELRFPTAASSCGFPPCGYSPPRDRITWIQWRSLPDERAVFHPVKRIFPVDQSLLKPVEERLFSPEQPGLHHE